MVTDSTAISMSAPGTGRQAPDGRRIARLVALVLALALGAAACGSSDAGVESDESSTTSAADGESGTDDTESASEATSSGRVRLGSSVLSKTLDPANQATSARFTGNIEFTGAREDDASASLAIVFEGAFDTASQATSMSMDLSGMMDAMADDPSMAAMGSFFDEPMQIIVIGDQGWMQWGLFSMMGVTPDQWVEMPADEVGTMTEGFGAGSVSDPTDLLRQLEDANAEIEELGTETVRGVETTHVKAIVDLGELSTTLAPEDAAKLAQSLGGAGVSELPIEFWVGDDGLIYRWSMSIDTPGTAVAEGLESMSMVYEIYDYGQDVGIVAPDPATVVSGADLGF